MGYVAMYFLSSSIRTFIKEIEPTFYYYLLNVDQSNATPDTAIFTNRKWISNILNIYIATAAKTIGKTQYPRTQTHWKNEICPPNSFVLIVTTNAPPHIIKNRTPKDFPLSWLSMPKFNTLH